MSDDELKRLREDYRSDSTGYADDIRALLDEIDRLRAQLATTVEALEAARLLADGVRVGWHRSNTGQMLRLSMDRAAEWLDRWSPALQRIKEGK